MAEKKKAKKEAKKGPEKKAVAKVQKPKEFLGTAKVIRWQAPDYYTFEKSPYWSFAVGALAIIFSLILIYTQNYFPVIIIILAVIVTFQIAHEKPKGEEFAIDEGGVLARNEYIPYLELKSFWVARHGTRTILYLEPMNRLRTPIVIPLGKQNVTELRGFLLKFLPEQFERGEMLSDKLIRIFRL